MRTSRVRLRVLDRPSTTENRDVLSDRVYLDSARLNRIYVQAGPDAGAPSRDEFKLRPYSTYHGGVFDT
jgi:hypothetical protein